MQNMILTRKKKNVSYVIRILIKLELQLAYVQLSFNTPLQNKTTLFRVNDSGNEDNSCRVVNLTPHLLSTVRHTYCQTCTTVTVNCTPHCQPYATISINNTPHLLSTLRHNSTVRHNYTQLYATLTVNCMPNLLSTVRHNCC